MESVRQIKISIIVPVYNVEKYLRECLHSILNQTYKNLEIICINDGSTDNSASILDEFANKDKRIVVINTNNGGVSRARNLGLDIATGDYIGFIDSDDYALPEMYQQMVDLLKRNDADISICSFVNIRNFYYGPDIVMSSRQSIYSMNEGEYFEGHLHNKLYKKELWSGIRLNENIAMCEDLLVNHYLFAKSNKVVFQNLPLYYYRPNPNSACRDTIFNPKFLTVLEATKEISEFLISNRLDQNDFSSIILFKGYLIALQKLYTSTKIMEYVEEKKYCLRGYRKYYRIGKKKYSNTFTWKINILGLKFGYLPYKIICSCISIGSQIKHFLLKEHYRKEIL